MIHRRWEPALLLWAGAATLQTALYLVLGRMRDATAVAPWFPWTRLPRTRVPRT